MTIRDMRRLVDFRPLGLSYFFSGYARLIPSNSHIILVNSHIAEFGQANGTEPLNNWLTFTFCRNDVSILGNQMHNILHKLIGYNNLQTSIYILN